MTKLLISAEAQCRLQRKICDQFPWTEQRWRLRSKKYIFIALYIFARRSYDRALMSEARSDWFEMKRAISFSMEMK
jgi:hypothetical protein